MADEILTNAYGQTVKVLTLHAVERGPVIGTYMDEPIHDWILMNDGLRYYYDGIAPTGKPGFVDMQRAPAGMLVSPNGLAYLERKTATPATGEFTTPEMAMPSGCANHPITIVLDLYCDGAFEHSFEKEFSSEAAACDWLRAQMGQPFLSVRVREIRPSILKQD